MALWV